jgi:hypothetical protein
MLGKRIKHKRAKSSSIASGGFGGLQAHRTRWGPAPGITKKKHTPGYMKKAKW